jgi:RND family efflux transporter MFP subunit
MRFTGSFLCVVILAGIVSCIGGRDQAGHEEGGPNPVSFTAWGRTFELFVEFEPPIAGRAVKFIVHLTRMSDFKPVRQGRVRITGAYANDESVTVESDTLIRDGIFTPRVIFPDSGECLLALSFQGGEKTESFTIGRFRIHPVGMEIRTGSDGPADVIAFLKEQQWNTDFATQPAEVRPIRASVTATAMVKPRQNSYAFISSPVSGIVSVQEKSRLVVPGQRVSGGDILAVLHPPLGSEDAWTQRLAEFQRAQKDYQRAIRLRGTQALSEREFEAIEQDFLTRKAGMESLRSAFEADSAGLEIAGGFGIQAPFSGVIADVRVYPGQKVDTGERLMSLVDPGRVWIQANLHDREYYRLETIGGLTLRVPGLDRELHVAKRDLAVIARSEMVDPETRTYPLIIEVANPGRTLKIGQALTAVLYADAKESRLAVPRSAVFEDRGRTVVFVQAGGESFERRVVSTGEADQEWIGIGDGLRSGERIVTRGGYMVKLAGTTETIGHGHAH